MAMTYSDANISIEQNTWFRARTRTAVSTFSNYLLNTPESDPDYTAKINSGEYLAKNIDLGIMTTLMFTLAGDSEVQAAGPGIADAQLQSIVEKTIAKFWPVQTAPVGFGGQRLPQFPLAPPQ